MKALTCVVVAALALERLGLLSLVEKCARRRSFLERLALHERFVAAGLHAAIIWDSFRRKSELMRFLVIVSSYKIGESRGTGDDAFALVDRTVRKSLHVKGRLCVDTL